MKEPMTNTRRSSPPRPLALSLSAAGRVISRCPSSGSPGQAGLTVASKPCTSDVAGTSGTLHGKQESASQNWAARIKEVDCTNHQGPALSFR